MPRQGFLAPPVLLLAALASAQCIAFGPFQAASSVPAGVLPSGTLTEISGVEASRRNHVHAQAAVGDAAAVQGLALTPGLTIVLER